MKWWTVLEGQSISAAPVAGHSSTNLAALECAAGPTIGALRVVRIGDSRLYEKLVSLDDEEHILKWRLVSHPDSINPFPASFVNYLSTMQLRSVTVGEQTFWEWNSEFFTEQGFAEGMRQTFESMYLAGFSSLQEYLRQQQLRKQPGNMIGTMNLNSGGSQHSVMSNSVEQGQNLR
ncbi:hypothetical protein WJX72_003998 [[Myrmecia] bisecta]|uniref:PRELI/MSF1 domain-containing protein n=1 Tax=[Myrmecia] bisecta TaxID=41462 RepID=A0AAW1QPZ3_9CHLO